MDPRFPITRDDLFSLQMDLKHIQLLQSSQAERLARLERRQEQDAQLKSVWQQHPFPGVLAGTPQCGPTHFNPSDLYETDDQENLLGSLHLEPAEEEPVRRGAASRANSVRFDESALRQSDWASHSNRHSGEFGPSRPSSGMLMERTFSHKSDGRHSSAGHSVHSLASGRASSLGLHTNYTASSSNDDDSPVDAPGPPPEFFILGSVPSIVRCWLTPHFAHNTIQYVDICTGSQKSIIDYSVVRHLDLADEIQRDLDGLCRLRIPVYLVEATVAERPHRPSNPGQIPSITATFEVTGMEQDENTEMKKGIQVFIGSDTLRAHVADVLLSQNRMVLVGNDREKLSVPFVRPEDDAVFKHIYTTNAVPVPEKPKLNANAAPFVLGELSGAHVPAQRALDKPASNSVDVETSEETVQGRAPSSSSSSLGEDERSGTRKSGEAGRRPETDGEAGEKAKESNMHPLKTKVEEEGLKQSSSSTSNVGTEGGRQPASGMGIWGSWRHGTPGVGAESGQRDGAPLSGYQPAGRGGRSMRVLKPLKASSSSSSARTGTSYEPAPAPRSSGEYRRKSQTAIAATGVGSGGGGGGSDSGSSNGIRWESSKRAMGTGAVHSSRDARSTTSTTSAGSGSGPLTPLTRSANPIGGASAFSWMNPAGKSKPAATAE
ncbi:hypothetical protein ACRALDRAFT_2043571 [Sodiomyces alcalophilus JCM 7366]|uniref:uncharacterized protein n=1 Tax=Sodiomyces alcalophilus JCM 7366 TaxID=591952 RepID=UPI0039B519A1